MELKCACCGCKVMAKYAIKYGKKYICRDCYRECDF